MVALPPSRNENRVTWFLSRMQSQDVDDAIQDAWVAYLEDRTDPVTIVARAEKAATRRRKFARLLSTRGGVVARLRCGKLEALPNATAIRSKYRP